MSTKPSAKIRALILKANRAYNKATPAQRRVLIAQDVLQRLDAGQIVAQTGNFVNVPRRSTVPGMVNLQELIHNGIRCNCCGIGSLFLSAVAYRNQYNMRNEYGNCMLRKTSDPLRQLTEFSLEQRRLIELAFEGGCGWHSLVNDDAAGLLKSTPERELAAEWSYTHKLDANDNDAILTALMENIIRNKGTFDPSEK